MTTTRPQNASGVRDTAPLGHGSKIAAVRERAVLAMCPGVVARVHGSALKQALNAGRCNRPYRPTCLLWKTRCDRRRHGCLRLRPTNQTASKNRRIV